MKKNFSLCFTLLIFYIFHAQSSLYFNGDILTMKGKKPNYLESVLVNNGKIIFTGAKKKAIRLAGKNVQLVNLKGKTLMPGFIDAHGHFLAYGRNLLDCDLKGVKNIPELISRMKKHLENVPKGSWCVGMGYDPLILDEKRHPTASELDDISGDTPVLVVHVSGHGGSMNSSLIKNLNISSDTKNPVGGEFLRKSGTNEILGGMEETALIEVRGQRPKAMPEDVRKIIKDASYDWAKSGQTTAMECGMGLGSDDIDIVHYAINNNLLPIDLVVFAKESATDDLINAAYSIAGEYNTPNTIDLASNLLQSRPDLDKRYINRVRLGGIKFWLDGNPVNAWMSKEYAKPPVGRDEHFHGYRQISDSLLQSFFDKYWKTDMQINMHVLGDAASEQALKIIENTIKKQGMSDHRPVFVHGAYLRNDQILRIKKVGGIPSFLSISLYNSADITEPLWGKERAENTNAAKSMIENGVTFTISHDAPISPPVLLPGVWEAVNRKTLSGKTLGENQKISPYQGLVAITRSAAYQIKEEKNKGTIEVGKLADFVILDKNPLKVNPIDIKDIQVFQTIKDGNSVYQKLVKQ